MRLFERRLLGEARRARLGLGLTVGLGALGGVLTVLQARALSQAVNQVFLGHSPLAGIRPLLVVLLILALARAATIWTGEAAAGGVAARVKTGLRERLFGRLLELGPAYARGERTGELANTATEGIETLDAYFSQYLPQLALAVLVPLIILAFVFPLDPISGLVLLLTAPLIPIFMILIGSQADAMTRRQWLSLSRMSAHFLDVLQGLPTLKLFNRSRDQVSAIAEISDRHRRATMSVLQVAFLSALVLELVATISTAVVAVEVGLRLLYGGLAFEQAFFILILAPEFYLPLRLLGARFHAGVAGATAAGRLFEILDTNGAQRPGTRDRELVTWDPGDGPADPAITSPDPQSRVTDPHSTISFRNVGFTYPGEARAALEDISFDLLPGQMVALVGPSGGGKSTIAQLLLRFAEPSSGAITLDGRPLRDLPADTWRGQAAWVPQAPYLLNASVAENIRLGRPGASIEQIRRAAQQAGADGFIQALPLGYDTAIGEQGARLSGGQAQRLALARAFLRDAPLVILDEATAHLDPETEAEIAGSLERLLAGRTALVIAHRLRTVRRADLILVLDAGQIVQAGTHAVLSMNRDGLYARMLAAQAATGATAGHAKTASSADPDVEPTNVAGFAAAGPSPRDAISSAPAAMAAELHPATAGAASASDKAPDTLRAARSTLHVFRFLFSFLAPVWPRILLSVLLGFAAVACGIGLMGASAWIIASAALGPSIAELQVAIVGVRFFGIARGFARYGERLVSHDVTFRVLARLRIWFYAAIEPLAPAGLARQRSGDLLSRVIGDIGALENFYVRAVAPAAVAGLTALLSGFLVGRADARLAVALLAFLALGGVVAPLLVRSLSRQPGRRIAAVRGELNASLVDGIQGIADVTAFGAAGVQMERVARLSRELSGLQRRMTAIGGLNAALVALCTGLAALAVLAGATPLVAGGELSGVSLAVLLMIALASFEAIAPLPAAVQQLDGSLDAGRRLLELVGAAAPASPPVRAAEVAAPAPETIPAISVEDLRFRYEDAGPWVLDGVSFDLPPGGHLAIVGPSGSGKTTLANLLVRFWDAQGGGIRLAGRDVRESGPDAVRRSFGVVAQHTHLFSGTIRANLLLAQPGARQVELDRAVSQAQLADFIRGLPEGYDTWVGEYGLRLSGGERQRLAIARALLKDAPVLILDEPVANLDPITARSVLAAIRALASGRSVLSITHSLRGAEEADQVLVLRDGAIVERGRHADLLAEGGFYSRMWLSEQDSLRE